MLCMFIRPPASVRHKHPRGGKYKDIGSATNLTKIIKFLHL